MKKTIISAFSLLLISTATFAQTADEIVTKYITAIGGRDAIAKIKDMTVTYTGEAQGASLEIVYMKKAPKFSQVVNVVGMGEVQKTVSDGTKVRVTSMQGGTQDVNDPEKVKATSIQSLIVPEADYIASGAKLTLIGKEKLNNKDVYKIEVVMGGAKLTEYYDVESGLKVRQIVTAETPMGAQTITSDYGDYKEVNGVKFASKLDQDLGMMQIGLTVTKIEVNTNLADSLFEIK